MERFERDPMHYYRADLRMHPAPEEIADTRRSIESHLGNEHLRESYSLELNFTHEDLRVVAHAGTITSPYKTEAPAYLSVDYMRDGHEIEGSISVHLPSNKNLPPKIKEREIKDERMARLMGTTAAHFLVSLVDYNAMVAEQGYSDEETSINMSTEIMLDIIKNGIHAVRSYSPLFEASTPSGDALPTIPSLVSALRSSLSRSNITQHYITHQAPKYAFMTAGGIVVSPTFERRVTVDAGYTDIDDIFQVELDGNVEVEDGGDTVPLKVMKTLCLPLQSQPLVIQSATPPLPRFGTGFAELSNFIEGSGRHSRMISHSSRNAVRGDLNYFLNMLRLAPKPKA